MAGIEDAHDALKQQIGGGHYKGMAIQPVEYIHKNGIPFIEGCVIKYVSRWRSKGGIEDIKKAKHFLDLLIALEMKAPPAMVVTGAPCSDCQHPAYCNQFSECAFAPRP